MSEQPRVPAGSPKGGQWTDQGASALPKPDWERQWAVHEDALDNMVDLTENQEKAVENYASTPGFYNAIANKLRGTNVSSEWEGAKPEDRDVETAIKDLDAAIAKQKPAKASFEVYRGISIDHLDIDPKLSPVEGRRAFAAKIREIQDSSFVSASANRDTAQLFTESATRGVLLRIHVPKGVKSLPIAKGGPNEGSNEEEFLFARGTKIRILHVQPADLSNTDFESLGIIDCEIVK